MSRRLMSVLGVVVALLLLSGCTQTQNQQRLKAFVGGTEGLRAYLQEGMPPPEIHDANVFPFGVGVVLENVGEEDVGPGTDNPFVLVRLVGINPEQFGTTDDGVRQMLGDPLQGAMRNFDGSIFPGEITTAVFDDLMYRPDIRGNSQFTIRADICYDYATTATAMICLKDDVLDNIQDTSICNLVGEKNPQNSGGPIHVTSVVQNPMSTNKIQVNFKIEHVGIGEFFGRPVGDTNAETCDFSVRNTNKFYVDVFVKPLDDSGTAISCSRFGGGNQGRVKLYQGAPTTISCTVERTRSSSGRIYQEPLNVQLKYRYGQFIETPITVLDVTN